MNKTQKKWLKGLRSDEYEQGGGQMRSPLSHDNTYLHCCLGVECDIEYGDKVFTDAGDVRDPSNRMRFHTITLPDELLAKLKLHKEDCHYLATFNDDGASFLDIADVLEHTFRDGTISVTAAAEELGALGLLYASRGKEWWYSLETLLMEKVSNIPA